jgi:hypothetical protein
MVHILCLLSNGRVPKRVVSVNIDDSWENFLDGLITSLSSHGMLTYVKTLSQKSVIVSSLAELMKEEIVFAIFETSEVIEGNFQYFRVHVNGKEELARPIVLSDFATFEDLLYTVCALFETSNTRLVDIRSMTGKGLTSLTDFIPGEDVCVFLESSMTHILRESVVDTSASCEIKIDEIDIEADWVKVDDDLNMLESTSHSNVVSDTKEVAVPMDITNDRFMEDDLHPSAMTINVKHVDLTLHLDGFPETHDITVSFPVNVAELNATALRLFFLPQSCQIQLSIGSEFSEDSTLLTEESLTDELRSRMVLAEHGNPALDVVVYPIRSFVVDLMTKEDEDLLRTSRIEVDPFIDWESFWAMLVDSHREAVDPKDLLSDRSKYRLCVFDPGNQVEYRSTKSFRNGDQIATKIVQLKPFTIPPSMTIAYSGEDVKEEPISAASKADTTSHMNGSNKQNFPSQAASTSAANTVQQKQVTAVKSQPIIKDPFENAIQETLAAIGIQLKASEYSKLKARSSTVEGAMEYYFSNMNLFAVADETANDSESIVVAATLVDQAAPHQHGSRLPIARVFPSSLQRCRHQDIAGQLWEMGFDEKDILNALRRNSTLEAAAAYIMGDIEGSEPVTCTCPICLSDTPVGEIYTMNCCKSHKVCMPCAVYYLKLALLGDNQVNTHLPACPQAVKGSDNCAHLLEQDEITMCLDLAQQQDLVTRVEVQAMKKSMKRLYNMKLRRENNYVLCVNCPQDDEGNGCSFSLDGIRPGDYVCVQCPRCETSFCSKCNVQPYHYGCSCEEMVAFSRSWRDWKATEKEAYLRKVAQDSAKHQAMLREYQSKQEEHRREVEAAEARYQELQRDEEVKAARCKRCPHCNRVVEKIDGCDLMACGRNYHGGDNQSGCGKEFRWTQAAPYVADTGARRTVNELNMPEPQEAQQVEHLIAIGIPLKCDGCHAPIIGPRIKCLNCPSTNLCLTCSYNSRAHVHCHDHKNHVCTVVWRSEHMEG